MKTNEIKRLIKEAITDKTTREIKVYKPVVSYGGKIKNQANCRYPVMSDVMWELKKDDLIEKHPEGTIIVNDGYRFVMLIDGKIEKDDK